MAKIMATVVKISCGLGILKKSRTQSTSSDTGHYGQNSLINGLIDKQQKYIHVYIL